MIILPEMKETTKSRADTAEFKGYNHGLYISDGEFYECQNIVSDYYPVFSPRGKRGIIKDIPNCKSIYATDKLMWVSGTKFYYDGNYVCEVEDNEKTFIKMGALIVVFPDKIIFNTAKETVEHIEESYTTNSTVTYTLCKADGDEYSNVWTGPTEPTDKNKYNTWLDTSIIPNELKTWSATYSQWTAIATTYVKISETGMGTKFNLYDTVTIYGSTDNQFNTDMNIMAIDDDYIVVVGIITETFTQNIPLTLERRCPDLDYVTECGNRIWGCSSKNHEIYACKLGDPKNWFSYMGIAGDSYAATVGSAGDFTGAATHLGYVLFFKEDLIVKIYGNMPSNYQLSEINCRGVEKGSEKSLVILNEMLFYKAKDAICIFDGSLPTSISQALGNVTYTEAVAGSYGDKYLICMKDTDLIYHTFVYDYSKGIFTKQDNEKIKAFCNCNGILYFMAEDTLYTANPERAYEKMYPSIMQKEEIYTTIDGNEQLSSIIEHIICPSPDIYPNMSYAGNIEGDVEWYAETGDIGITTPDHKYISKIQLRTTIDEEAEIRVEVQYESDGIWKEVYKMQTTRKRSFYIPIIPKRCDHMKLRISGKGMCKIYGLSKTIEEGSEM